MKTIIKKEKEEKISVAVRLVERGVVSGEVTDL